jgi:hypothetical protein
VIHECRKLFLSDLLFWSAIAAVRGRLHSWQPHVQELKTNLKILAGKDNLKMKAERRRKRRRF